VSFRPSNAIALPLHTLYQVGTLSGLSDAALLERFLARQDAASDLAFEVLVRRHGPMVLRVCRSVLSDPFEAQDAFQATFLVLLRRAGSIRRRESLGGWLYGVAGRVAAAARVDEARRRAHERRLAERTPTTIAKGPDLAPAVREEVDRLPESLRAPVVLCYLEGRTHDEAAGQPSRPRSGPETELKRLRREWNEAILRRDAETVGRLLDDRFVSTDPVGGLLDRDTYLKEVDERAWGLTSLANDDVEVRVFGASAVMTARVRWEVRYQGEESEGVDRSTFVFVKADNRWRCVAAHSCRLAKKSNVDNLPTLPSLEDAPPARAKTGRRGTRRPSP
jgi:RNA polymerase sigma factor (sigma-70 family)